MPEDMPQIRKYVGDWGSIGLVVIGIITTGLGGVGYAIHRAERDATAAAKLQDVDKEAADHESRLRSVESTLGALSGKLDVVQSDVHWIREYFDPDKHGRTASAKP
jgi:hypothetical protein